LIKECGPRQQRKSAGDVLLAQGQTHDLAGENSATPQGGNNNAYAQDNSIKLARWENITPGAAVFVSLRGG